MHILRYSVVAVALVLCPGLEAAADDTAPEQPPIPAQPYFGRRTTADGLPDDTVRSLLQDRVGFLWIGTQNGLARYDGNEMRVFRPQPGDSTGIAGRDIFGLHEDLFGCIWVATAASGLSRLEPRTGIFTNYASTMTGPGALPGRFVLGIASTADSTVWVGMQDAGLAYKRNRDAGFTRVTRPGANPKSSRGDSVTALLAARNGKLFAGMAGGGVGRYDPATRTWRVYEPRTGNPAGPRPGLINHIFEDRADRVWFATANGLALWDESSETLRWYQARPTEPDVWENYMTRVGEGASGILWIGSAVGLYRFDPNAATFRLFRHDPRHSGSIAPGPVMTVLCDRSGVIWTGGWQSGVSFLDPWRTRFELWTHDGTDSGSLDQNAIVSVLEGADGTLWAGTGGVTGVGEIGRLNRRRFGEARFTRVPLEIEARTVLALCEDAQRTLWIGTDRGLLCLPSGAETARRPTIPALDTAALAASGVYALGLDHSGALWVGSFGRGLFRIDLAQNAVARFAHDPADDQSLSQNRITRLHCDNQGRMWVGTSTAGINLFEPTTGKFRRFVEPRSGLGTITDFEDAPEGGVYVATGAGVFVVRPDAASTPWLDPACGLSDVPIASMVRDRSGEIWLHTPRGLYRCGDRTSQAQLYDSYYGVPPGEMYFQSCAGAGGQLYFGSKSGLLVVDPRAIHVDPNVPPVVITGLQVNDAPAGPETRGAAGHVFPFVDRIVLPYDQNDLRFNFAALRLAQPERMRYRYRLRPDDEAWRTPSTQSTANYTNLSPGSHRFEVQVGTARDDWSPTGAALDIRITPPWWRTNWARLAYALIAAGFAAIIYRLIVQRERIRGALEVERAEARHLQELDHVKSRFFANISHEFRTPLTLILGPLGRLQQSATGAERNSLQMIQRNARRLGELIEQLLDLSRLESGRMTVRWQRRDVLSWLRALVSSFDSLAADRGIALSTAFPTGALEVWFGPDLLEKSVVNLLSNAFKFTPAGGAVRVVVEIVASPAPAARVKQGTHHMNGDHEAEAQSLHLTVTNSGSFIRPESLDRIFERFHQLPEGVAAGGTGIGLALTKELVELLGGRIAVESSRERGTCFTLEVPIHATSPVAGPEDVDVEAPSSPVDTASAPGVEESTIAPEPQVQVANDEAARASVLVVEDNADLRAFLASELGDAYEVLQAADGTAGLAMAIEQIPDLVLSDVIMPGLDGVELCRRVKTDPRTDHIPIILLSARTEVESRLAGLSGGADDYQAKPFDPRELRLRVRNLIEARRQLRERYAHQVQLGAAAMSVTSAEERFLKRACEIIDAHIDNSGFGVEELAVEIGMSKAQLLRKVRAVTGAAPRDLIRTYRLQRAAHLLASGYGNVTEVAYAVGMESLSTFAKRFKEQYGVAPSEYPSTVTAPRAPAVRSQGESS